MGADLFMNPPAPEPVRLYVLSHSAYYYPGAGTSDWKGVFKSEDEAKKALETLELESYESAVVIAIDPDECEYEEMWIRDADQGGDVLTPDQHREWLMPR